MFLVVIYIGKQGSGVVQAPAASPFWSRSAPRSCPSPNPAGVFLSNVIHVVLPGLPRHDHHQRPQPLLPAFVPAQAQVLLAFLFVYVAWFWFFTKTL